MNEQELKRIRRIQKKALAHSKGRPNLPRGSTSVKFGLFTRWFSSDSADKVSPEQIMVDLHITPMTAQKWVRQIECGMTAVSPNEIEHYKSYLKNLVYSGNATSADRELYAKIIGAFENKSKIEISGLLSHDIIAGIILKADRDSAVRVQAMPERPDLLCDPSRLPSGQGKDSDGKV